MTGFILTATHAVTHLHCVVVVHGSRQRDRGSVVREGPEHMQVSGHRTQEVQAQVAQSHDGIAEEAKSLEGQDQNPLVFFPFLRQKKTVANISQQMQCDNEVMQPGMSETRAFPTSTTTMIIPTSPTTNTEDHEPGRRHVREDSQCLPTNRGEQPEITKTGEFWESYCVVGVFRVGGGFQDCVSSLNERLKSFLHPPQLRQHLCQFHWAGMTGKRGQCWS